MIRFVLFAFFTILLSGWQTPLSAGAAADDPKLKPLPPIPLSLNEVLAWIDRSHPLLQGAGTEKIAARGKLLRALGAFEPTLVNDMELERFISSVNCLSETVRSSSASSWSSPEYASIFVHAVMRATAGRRGSA